MTRMVKCDSSGQPLEQNLGAHPQSNQSAVVERLDRKVWGGVSLPTMIGGFSFTRPTQVRTRKGTLGGKDKVVVDVEDADLQIAQGLGLSEDFSAYYGVAPGRTPEQFAATFSEARQPAPMRTERFDREFRRAALGVRWPNAALGESVVGPYGGSYDAQPSGMMRIRPMGSITIGVSDEVVGDAERPDAIPLANPDAGDALGSLYTDIFQPAGAAFLDAIKAQIGARVLAQPEIQQAALDAAKAKAKTTWQTVAPWLVGGLLVLALGRGN
jgi:hypothetical protein